MGVNREKAYDAVLVALKGPNPVGGIEHLISLQERVLDLEAEFGALIERIENSRLGYFGDHTGYTVQFGTPEIERIKRVLSGEAQ